MYVECEGQHMRVISPHCQVKTRSLQFQSNAAERCSCHVLRCMLLRPSISSLIPLGTPSQSVACTEETFDVISSVDVLASPVNSLKSLPRKEDFQHKKRGNQFPWI